MAKKFNGKLCPACGQGHLNHGVKALQFHYRGQVMSYEQTGAWCDSCDEGVMTGVESASTSQPLEKFIANIDETERELLQRVRKKLGLTQHQASLLTGGGHNAFSRYERGEAQPLPAVVNLFRLLDKHPELMKELAA